MSKRQSGEDTPPRAEPNDPSAGPATPPGDRSSAPGDLPEPAASTTTNDPNANPQRTGVDTRHRGWYWHWNGIVTQYAPLIGLKGVGLLNSYTVWTDRREQSPTRGYAFPSQQSEADFYGEDRSELITINKILVALDLIEIRKEMVLRTDPQGRKWRVPHNLYRVKDRPEGIELRTADVLRVAELASRDAAVFRYLKRIFSNRFTPIDRDNVWHRILTEVACDPIWQALTDKTSKIEARASARSRAGHKARDKKTEPAATETAQAEDLDTPEEAPSTSAGPLMTSGHLGDDPFSVSEHPAGNDGQTETTVAHDNNGSTSQKSDVATSNTGLETDVDAINTGLKGGDESSAEPTNNGQPSVVARSNATYYQEISTTTTTTTGAKHDDRDDSQGASRSSVESRDSSIPSSADDERGKTGRPAGAGSNGLDDRPATLPARKRSAAGDESLATPERSLADPGAGGPLVDPSPLVVSLFEAANDRRASPLERTLLAELERDADPAARPYGESGTEWVAAALREAVSSGSAFVAPKRIREIIIRWAATGHQPQLDPLTSLPAAERPAQTSPGDSSAPVRLPRGRSAATVWQAVLDDLGRVLDAHSHERLFSESQIIGYQRGNVVIQVLAEAQDKLAAEYRPLLERHLERHIGKPVTVRFAVAVASEPEEVPAGSTEPARIQVSAADVEQGRQLWRAVLSEVRAGISADDLARLRGALPLGQDGDGRIVVGAPTSLAARLIDGRCRSAIESALSALLGDSATVRVADSSEWSVIQERAEG